MNKAVFFDRDGILNKAIVRDRKPYSPRSVSELEINKTLLDPMLNLRTNGYLLFSITNQPDVARGLVSFELAHAINTQVIESFPLDDHWLCPHSDRDRCYFRKPNPGAIERFVGSYDINPEKSFFVGDRWKDIECGERAGCQTILVDYSYDESFCAPNIRCKSISELCEILREL